MKICFLAPANNYHTKKWCEYFVNQGYEVHVISFIKGSINNVNVHYIDSGVNADDNDIKKIKYLFKYRKVKKIINDIKPDIISAHYATSYGMIGALCNLEYSLSVWGSDVYIFPNKSFLHKLYFKYLINKPKYILSTSNCMKKEISKYTNKDIYVTPFGIKMDLFKPNKRKNKTFTVGTIKPLKDIYGIKNIIDSIEIINNTRKDIDIEVLIAGTGPKEKEYKEYAINKNIKIQWLGNLGEKEVVNTLNNMDIALFPSISESFGVSTIEAEACEIPVIISNVEGLLETTTDKSRIVVPCNDPESLAKAIINLYDNPNKRIKMGVEGRKYVENKYEYNKCFKYIEELLTKDV